MGMGIYKSMPIIRELTTYINHYQLYLGIYAILHWRAALRLCLHGRSLLNRPHNLFASLHKTWLLPAVLLFRRQQPRSTVAKLVHGTFTIPS